MNFRTARAPLASGLVAPVGAGVFGGSTVAVVLVGAKVRSGLVVGYDTGLDSGAAGSTITPSEGVSV